VKHKDMWRLISHTSTQMAPCIKNSANMQPTSSVTI